MLRKSICISTFAFLLFSAAPELNAGNIQKTDTKHQKVKLIPMKSFQHTDVGNPAIAGTVTSAKEGFDITAGGADIWGVKDEFNFVYVERTGDFDFVTRIESLTAPHLYTKAGIMAREDLSADCRHIYFQVFPNNNPRNKNNGGFEFQYRQQSKGEMKAIYPASASGTPEFPVTYPNTWVRLQRVNNEFTGYYSADGKNWKVYTKYTLELPSKIYLGLAVTSHNTKEAASASFRNTGEIKH
jgi:hypothetical protein